MGVARGPGLLDPDRLFPEDRTARALARDLHDRIAGLPIVSPHGHADPAWFARNEGFADAATLLLTPDHYLLRMLFSRGVSYDDLGVPRRDGDRVGDGRPAWRLFAAHCHLLLGTPSRLWIDHCLNWALGIDEVLCPENADRLFDLIGERLADDAFRPRAILDRARVEVIATTEGALDDLPHHRALEGEGLIGRIRTTYRPDDVTDPDAPGFLANLATLDRLTGQDTADWDGMIDAHRLLRAGFRHIGATATDHGMPDATIVDLPAGDRQALLTRIFSRQPRPGDAALFRAQMLTEMAALSAEDGMVMQLHAGVRRNTDPTLLSERASDLGADIPAPVDPVRGLAPPLLGPPWWFHDSPRGIARYLDAVIESAGVFNLAGFNDDNRALLSTPARHDVWRRSVATFLARIAEWLAYGAAKAAYRRPAGTI